MFLYKLKLLLCHFIVLDYWWFAVWLLVPSLALLVAWQVAKRQEVPEKSAWNTLGKQWADMGWALLGAAFAVYIIVSVFVFRVQLAPPLSLSDAVVGFTRSAVTFFIEKYYLLSSIVPLLAWGGLAWLIFIAPGHRIAKAKIKLD